ncbi:MAG: hypothetical protein ABL898_11465, partial [Hyphomicrobiaceae bacterium]
RGGRKAQSNGAGTKTPKATAAQPKRDAAPSPHNPASLNAAPLSAGNVARVEAKVDDKKASSHQERAKP